MKTTVLSALASLASVASAAIMARSCPEASRFGVFSISPTTVSKGDTITITVDLTCTVQNFGFVAEFIDYTLEVPAASNNGFEQPIVLVHRNRAPGVLSDSFTAKIPHNSVVAGTPYNVILNNVYPLNDTDGTQYLVIGGVEEPITINN